MGVLDRQFPDGDRFSEDSGDADGSDWSLKDITNAGGCSKDSGRLTWKVKSAGPSSHCQVWNGSRWSW